MNRPKSRYPLTLKDLSPLTSLLRPFLELRGTGCLPDLENLENLEIRPGDLETLKMEHFLVENLENLEMSETLKMEHFIVENLENLEMRVNRLRLERLEKSFISPIFISSVEVRF